jgi:hypothetical protein
MAWELVNGLAGKDGTRRLRLGFCGRVGGEVIVGENNEDGTGLISKVSTFMMAA